MKNREEMTPEELEIAQRNERMMHLIAAMLQLAQSACDGSGQLFQDAMNVLMSELSQFYPNGVEEARDDILAFAKHLGVEATAYFIPVNDLLKPN